MKTFIKKQPPGRLIAMGFAMVILIGTCLLLTPWSVRQGVTVKPVDALFSATSAVCVTGLVTIDTADHFTAFGQAIMGLLIQIGGLGVSSVGVGLVIAAGKKHIAAILLNLLNAAGWQTSHIADSDLHHIVIEKILLHIRSSRKILCFQTL